MVVVLYNIRSGHNVGSIFRTADALGVEKMYLAGYTPAPVDEFLQPHPPVAKVSLGAEKSVAWEKAEDILVLLRDLKKRGFYIYALEQDLCSVPYYTVKPNAVKLKSLAVILGEELHGIPKEVLKQVDAVLEIPMRGKKESLNVSVAFGIVAFSLVYQVVKIRPPLRGKT